MRNATGGPYDLGGSSSFCKCDVKKLFEQILSEESDFTRVQVKCVSNYTFPYITHEVMDLMLYDMAVNIHCECVWKFIKSIIKVMSNIYGKADFTVQDVEQHAEMLKTFVVWLCRSAIERYGVGWDWNDWEDWEMNERRKIFRKYKFFMSCNEFFCDTCKDYYGNIPFVGNPEFHGEFFRYNKRYGPWVEFD